MGKPGPEPDVTLEDALSVFDSGDRQCDPLTATEVAEELGCTRRTAHRKLEQLVEDGDLETKKVGARSRVWWRRADPSQPTAVEGGRPIADQFGEFVSAVRDYAIFMLDADGNVANWNEGAVRTKGYEEAEIVGEHFSTFYTEADVEAGVPERNLRIASEEGRCEDEGWRVRKDGSEFWANVVITAIRDEDGSLQGYTKVTRDLTERKRAEDERRLQHSVSASIARAESLEDGLEAAVEDVCELTEFEYGEVWLPSEECLNRLSATVDPAGAFESFASESRTYGFEAGEGLVGRVWASGTSEWVPDVADVDVDVFERTEPAAAAGLHAVHCVPVSTDDDVAAVLLFGLPDPRETDERLVDVVESVAAQLGGLVARQRTEDVLAREREFLDRILEASPVGISVFTADGGIVRSNSRAVDILGVEEERIYDFCAEDATVFDGDGDLIPPEERPLPRSLETGQPVYDWDCQIEPPDGARRWIDTSTEPLRDDDGSVRWVIATFEDVTDRKEREAQLRRERNFTDRILETVPVSVVVLNRDGEFERMNDRAKERLGVGGPEEYAIGDRDVYDADGNLLPPEERPYVEALRTGEAVYDWEGQIDLDAGRTWISMTCVPIGEDEPPECVVVAANDITRLKEQAARLERRRDELRTELDEVYARVDDAFYALDDEWRFTFVNAQAEAIFDRTEADLLGESLWNAFPETTEGPIWEKYHEAIETQEPVSFELFYTPLDIWAEINAYPSESGLSVYFQDITERIERERELQQYERIVETVEDGVYVLDADSRFQTVNAAHESLTGYDREELVGAHASLVTDSDNVERVDDMVDELLDADESETTVESTLRRADGETVPVETHISLYTLPDGGTGRVGVVRDVTDRRRREERLRALNESARSFLRADSAEEIAETVVEAANDILDIAGVGVYHLDADRRELYPAAVSMEAGFVKRDLRPDPVEDSSLVGDVFREGEVRRFDDVLAEEASRVEAGETEMRAGVFVPMGHHGIVVGGNREVGAFDEETERLLELLAANAEAAYERLERQRELGESERRYRGLAENFPNGAVALFDEDLRFELVEGGIFGSIDVSADRIEGKQLSELGEFGLGEEQAPALQATLSGEETSFEVEVPGGIVFEVHNVPIRDEDGRVVYGLSMAQDVTDRVERERELEEYRAIVESVNDGVYTVDRSGTITRVNASYAEMVGRSREELVGMEAASLVRGDVAERARQLERELVSGEREEATLVAELERGTDGTFHAEATFSLLPGEGDAYERVAVVRDVTERRARERALKESEERYRSLTDDVLDTSDVGTFILNSDFEVVWTNQATEEYFDLDREEIIGRDKRELIETDIAGLIDDSEQFVDLVTSAYDDNTYTEEFECHVLGGQGRQERWLRHWSQPIESGLYAGGRIEHYTDVTDRKRRERELERYETIVETVHDGVYVVDEDYRFTMVNDAYVEMVGYPKEELIGSHITKVVDTETVETGQRLRDELIDGRGTDDTLEIDVETADGEVLTTEIRYGLLPLDEGEAFQGTVGVVRDVTERKERERELEEYERIVETVHDGLYVLDEDGRFRRVNEAFVSMTNFGHSELVGMHASSVFGETFEELDAEAHRQFESGEIDVATFEEEIYTADGETITVDSRFKQFDIGGGTGRVGSIRDITDRIERERELHRALDLLERTENIADVGGWEIDPETTEVFWSDHLFELLGRDPEEAEEPPLEEALDVYHPEDRPAVEAAVEEAMAEGGTFDIEARYHRDDGELRWFRILGLAETEGEGIVKLRGAVQDITDRKRREQALQRYKTVFDTVDDGIYILGPDFHFQEVNDAYVEMTGYDREELVGAHCELVVGGDASEEAADLVQAALWEDEESSTLEADVITKDGERIPGEGKFSPLPSDDGFAGSVGVVRDLTDRREYERELRRYETLIEESTDVNAIIDADGTFDYLTPSAEFVLGYEPGELVGEGVFEYVHPDDREVLRRNFTALVEEEEDRPTTEFRFEHADGSWVWLEARGRNLEGDPIIDGIVVYTRDVTDRKRYERQLEFRTRQQSVISDLGRMALENPDVDDLFAEAARRVSETLDADFAKVLDLDPQAGVLHLRQGVGWDEGVVGSATVAADEHSQAGYTLQTEEPVVVEDLESETRFEGPDLLTSHDVTSGVSTIIGSSESPWGILGIHDTRGRDFDEDDVAFVQSVANVLTEAIRRQTYQEELEELIEELEESNRRLEQFAYIASHDLQEPLRMVSSYLQLVEDRYADELDEDAEEFIDFAVDGAERMREMINGLLAYSRVDTEAEPLEPTDSEEVVERALGNLQIQIEENDATVEVEPLPTVMADESQLEQVFQNLVSNAIKYRGEEPPEIEIGVERHAGEWTFHVADNGIGMDPDHSDRIFEVFDRLHSHEEYPGTGIGLALCKKIVDRHGGDIWVESGRGEGSTFYFSVPVAGTTPGPGIEPRATPEASDE